MVSAIRKLLDDNPSLPLVLLAIGALLVCTTSDAGYYPTVWYGGGLAICALLAIGLVALGSRIAPTRVALWGIVLLGAFALWSYASIAWAGDRATAFDGANRAAIYTAVLALVLLWPLDARGGRWVLTAVGLGLAAIGLWELLRAMSAEDPARWFIDARFSEPAGYINANVALWTVGLFPCAALAASRGAHPGLRGLALGASGLLGGLALLGQSRGWVVALPVALVVYLLLSPHRVRAAVPLLAVAAGVAAVAGPILAVHDVEGELADKLSTAGGDILVMAAVLAAVGVALALGDRVLDGRPEALDAGRTGLATLLLTATAIAAVMAVTYVDHPAGRASDAWEEFKRGDDQAHQGTSRFTTGGTNRYDFWRVAVDMFEREPVAGAGAENFQIDYLRDGHSGEKPRFPHSLVLGVLSQTGLVGLALFLGAFAAAILAAWSPIRRSTGSGLLAAGAAGGFVYWALHANVDWFWEFPALTGLALVLLGTAGALPGSSPRHTLGRWPRIAGVGGLAVVAAILIPTWISALQTDRAAKEWPADIDVAYARIDQARKLNPLSPRPDLVAATIAMRVDDPHEARLRLRAALRRQADTSYALLNLGVIAAERGDRRTALRLLRRALRTMPRSVIVRDTLRRVRAGSPVSLQDVNADILEDARGRVE